ncbi:MAG TPA: hypothetical protein VE268_04875, partial [Herpetosiphonaceae bacterium]|nr:hypothetical protein [Herpetosiphonaceae bacterium]
EKFYRDLKFKSGPRHSGQVNVELRSSELISTVFALSMREVRGRSAGISSTGNTKSTATDTTAEDGIDE